MRRLAAFAAVFVVVLAAGVAARPQPAEALTGVYPLLDCVSYDASSNQMTAYYGYGNTNPNPVTIPIGSTNYFYPLSPNQGQTTIFIPGVNHNVFRITWDYGSYGAATWNLLGESVSAGMDSPRCADNVPSQADVALTQSAAPEPVVAGNEITYTLTATNNGPDGATGATVSDPLPGGVNLVSADASQGSCSGTDTVSCEIGDLARDQSETVTIVVRPQRAGSLTNTASVNAGQQDPDASNNTATSRSTVVSPPTAATGAASDLTPDGATLNAAVDANGSATKYHFEYGTDTSYGQSTRDQDAGSDMGGQLVSAAIEGLQPGTVYHYRIVATNDQGTTPGEDRTFTTVAKIPLPPEVAPNTAPVISRFSPARGAGLRDHTPTILATVTDKETNLAKRNIRLWVDGKKVERFSYDRTKDRLTYTTKKLGHGRHTVLIAAADGKGLSASKFWGFRVAKR